MRKKILTSHIILIVLLSLSFVFIIKGALNQTIENRYRAQLVNELKLSKALFEAKPNQDLTAYANKLKSEMGVRVTLVDYEGNVLVDTDNDVKKMDNHRLREEIIHATKSNDVWVSTRYSDTVNTDYMYAAIPIENLFVLRLAMPLTAINALNKQIINFTFAFIGVALLISILLAYLISKKITEPIDLLTEATQEIAKGNYGKKVYRDQKDQMGLLTDAFNSMSLSLKETMHELNTRKSELENILNSMINGVIAVDSQYKILLVNPICFDILALEANYVAQGDTMYKIIRNEEIIALVEKAVLSGASNIKEIHYTHSESILRIHINPIHALNNTIEGCIIVIEDVTQMRKLEQMRTDFVSNVSHELKTPLTSIKGFVETLKNGALNSPETAMRFLDIIDIESDRLYRLINDILTLSDIEQMKSDRDQSLVDLKGVANEVYEMMKLSAEEKKLQLIVDVDSDAKIYANRDRIKQMLINLVDNALKYTEVGKIEVSGKVTSKGIHIKVSDTGIGFDEVHKDRLFERFYRVDKGRSRNKGGTGLGLSIVKHIALLYDGQIYVESTPNKGTTFDILFKVH